MEIFRWKFWNLVKSACAKYPPIWILLLLTKHLCTGWYIKECAADQVPTPIQHQLVSIRIEWKRVHFRKLAVCVWIPWMAVYTCVLLFFFVVRRAFTIKEYVSKTDVQCYRDFTREKEKKKHENSVEMAQTYEQCNNATDDSSAQTHTHT